MSQETKKSFKDVDRLIDWYELANKDIDVIKLARIHFKKINNAVKKETKGDKDLYSCTYRNYSIRPLEVLTRKRYSEKNQQTI
jgi:hypothetical protein